MAGPTSSPGSDPRFMTQTPKGSPYIPPPLPLPFVTKIGTTTRTTTKPTPKSFRHSLKPRNIHKPPKEVAQQNSSPPLHCPCSPNLLAPSLWDQDWTQHIQLHSIQWGQTRAI